MDDSILTLLFYVGIIIVISLSKYLSKFLKANTEVPSLSDVKDDENGEVVMTDDFSRRNYSQDRNIDEDGNYSLFNSSKHFEEGISAFSASSNATDHSNSTLQVESTSNVNSYLPFIADFDPKAAIIYSEILKRPNY